MDIIQLRYVTELARECNFSRAAEKLYITQPALSQRLRKLEQEIGFPLFARNTKQVKLTPAGKEFVVYANRVVEEFAQLEEFTKQTSQNLKEVITFGTSPSSSKLVSSAVPEFFSVYPNVHLSYVEVWDNRLLNMLKGKQLDIAMVLMAKDAHIRGVQCIPVFEDRVCVLVSREDTLAQRESVEAKDLIGRTLIFSSPESVIKQMVTPVLQNDRDMETHMLYVAEREARRPMIKRGAVLFSLYQRQCNKKGNEFCAIPFEPRIDAEFCFVFSGKEKLTEEKQALIKIGGEILCESLRNGI